MVHFYAELRRLALIAAIAERLRDQGVPLPAWMQDYPVKRLALPPTTPALMVEGSQTETQAAGGRAEHQGDHHDPAGTPLWWRASGA